MSTEHSGADADADTPTTKHERMVRYARENDDISVGELMGKFTLSPDEIDDAIDVLREVDPEALANDETVPEWARPVDLPPATDDDVEQQGDRKDDQQNDESSEDPDDDALAALDIPDARRAEMTRYVEQNSDVTVPALMGRFLLSPDDREIAETLISEVAPDDQPEAPEESERERETATDERSSEEQQAVADEDAPPSEGETPSAGEGDRTAWVGNAPGFLSPDDARYLAPEADVWPGGWDERETWMGRKEKLPFAPWGDRNADLPCNHTTCPEHNADVTPEDVLDACEACAAHRDGTTTAECGHDARYKWGNEAFYRSMQKVAMAEVDPQVDGRVFIQQPDDPYFFIDGDDVRCPETGEWHPAFLDAIGRTGATYADVSVSGSGGHLPYIGDLPEGLVQAKFPLDDEPWGANDDVPEIEMYATRRVCVTTGKHVAGTPTDVCEVDADGLRELLGEYDRLPEPREERGDAFEEYDPAEHEPSATGSDEITSTFADQKNALDRLDARDVAERTIVHSWNREASTSGRKKAFVPTWGTSANGTANVVDDEIWDDTGGGGYGGPVVIALVDLGVFNPSTADPRDASGAVREQGVEHLRGLGYDIPVYIPGRGSKRRNGDQYDKTPGWALEKAARFFDVIGDDDDLVDVEQDDGETFRGLSREAYNRTVHLLEREGIDTGRQTPTARKAATPTRAELDLDEEPEGEFGEAAQKIAESLFGGE